MSEIARRMMMTGEEVNIFRKIFPHKTTFHYAPGETITFIFDFSEFSTIEGTTYNYQFCFGVIATEEVFSTWIPGSVKRNNLFIPNEFFQLYITTEKHQELIGKDSYFPRSDTIGFNSSNSYSVENGTVMFQTTFKNVEDMNTSFLNGWLLEEHDLDFYSYIPVDITWEAAENG